VALDILNVRGGRDGKRGFILEDIAASPYENPVVTIARSDHPDLTSPAPPDAILTEGIGAHYEAGLQDTTPPYTAGPNPTKGTTGVAKDTNIVVHVKDDGDGVDQSSIVMTVEGNTVSPTITGTAADYTLSYDPPTDFDYEQVVNVTVDAQDLASPPNVMMQDSYSFTIEPESAPDTAPPSALTNLSTSSPISHFITLTWTAPGDDGNTGTASQYDIRYSTSKITEANRNSATQCTGEPSPQVAGSSETFTVTGLSSNTTYYSALETADEVPNWSEISSSPKGTTLIPPLPSWTVGLGGDAWSGNVTYDNTTEVQATGKVELRQLVDDYVSYWRFDEGYGTSIADENTVNSNNGTGKNFDTDEWVSGKFGNGINFDGINDYVDCGNDTSLNITDAITIEAWAKRPSGTGSNHIITKWYGGTLNRSWVLETELFAITESADVYGESEGYWAWSNVSVDDNKWHHIVGTWESGTKAKIYTDGVLTGVASTPVTDLSVVDRHVLVAAIGNFYTAGEITIDEIRIYNRALSAEEINQAMNNEHHTEGNLTSIAKDAETGVWNQISFNGTADYTTTVDIYVSSSKDNGVSDPWTDWTLVKQNAATRTTYALPVENQERYAKWRLTLNTQDASQTPEIDKVVFYAGVATGITSSSATIPDEYVNETGIFVYPNPFNQKTVIRYSLGVNRNDYTNVRLRIYDIGGRLVKFFPINQLTPQPINHQITWDGKDNSGKKVASGIYFIRLEAGDFKATRKLTVVK
jgi:hypothetical protein